MNMKVLSKPIKMRNKFSPSEIYYTFHEWPVKEIDGVAFLAVNKLPPSHGVTQSIHFVRKDSLEKIK